MELNSPFPPQNTNLSHSDSIVDRDVTFEDIKNIRLKIKNKLEYIFKTKENIKQNYLLYIRNEHSNDFFGLDSFHFQNKLMDYEYKHIKNMYIFIDNRIYGDYYKLIIKIQTFMKAHLLHHNYKNIKELNYIQDQYPVYKDLEPTTVYDFNIINNIQQDIMNILLNAKSIYYETENRIQKYNEEIGLGMNIDNYIISNEYKNNQLISSIELFEKYVNVYHKDHYELLFNYYDKLKLLNKHINQKYITSKDKRQTFISKMQSRRSVSAAICEEVPLTSEEMENTVVSKSTIIKNDEAKL